MLILDFSEKGSLDKLFREWQGGLKTTPGDYVRSLESGLPSCERNKRWIVALQVYLDASGMGNIKKDPYLVFAGFISTSKVWADFSDSWKAALDKPPSISYFKLNDAFSSTKNKKSQFYRWKETDIENKINELIKIIKSIKVMRVHSYVDKNEFKQLILEEFPKRRWDTPYWICCIYLMFKIISHQRYQKIMGYQVPIDFYFDEENKMEVDCKRWFNYFKKMYAPKWALPYCGSINSLDDKRFMPLQAADLYAGLLRRYLFENKFLYMPKSKELKSIEEIPRIGEEADLREISIWIQQDEIRQMMNKFRKQQK